MKNMLKKKKKKKKKKHNNHATEIKIHIMLNLIIKLNNNSMGNMGSLGTYENWNVLLF